MLRCPDPRAWDLTSPEVQQYSDRELFWIVKNGIRLSVRQDPLIGRIFNAKIKDWKHHSEIITSFWETLIGGPRSYARPMPMKHLPLRLLEEDFERWLFLWQANCRAQLPSDVAKEMIDLATHIANKLRMILGISV
jgi:hemoglobin